MMQSAAMRTAPGDPDGASGVYVAAFQVGMAAGGFGFGLLAAHAGYPVVFRAASAGLVLALTLLLVSGPRPARGAPRPGPEHPG